MKTILLAIISFVFFSCNNGLEQELIGKYKGGVIYEKVDVPRHLLYTIKHNNEIKTIRCYELEFIYNVGDTIK